MRFRVREKFKKARATPAGEGAIIPVNTVPPVFSGTPVINQTLVSTTGTYINVPTGYHYQHQSKLPEDPTWGDIAGATTANILLENYLLGYLVRPGTRAVNLAGTSAWAYGEALGPITTSSGGGTGGTDYTFAPVLRDRELHRTPMVDQDDEQIDLQREVAHPASPTVTSWAASGADSAYVEIADGIMTFKASSRADIPKGTTLSIEILGTNTYGSESCTLTIKVPLDADCRFCDFVNGADANNGTTPALAWKQMPRSLGFTGTQVTLGAGKVVFFRGNGTKHRYGLYSSTSGYPALPHSGTSGNNFVYSFSGWGGRAIFDGSTVVASTSAVTAEEVDNNPNWMHFRKGTLGSATSFNQHIFNGEDMLYPAQTPRPINLKLFEGPQDPSGDEGMYQVPVTTNTSIVPRISKSGNTITLVDPRVTAKIGNTDPVDRQMTFWTTGDVATGGVTSWDPDNDTIQFTSTSALRAGTSAWSLMFCPIQIEVPGQFALSKDRTTFYYWPTNSDEVSVAERNRGMGISMTNITVEGGQWQRFVGSGGGGVAFVHGGTSSVINGVIIRDHIIRQCRAESGDGLISGGGGITTVWNTSNIERIYFKDENPKASGLKIGNRFNGVPSGTPAEVRDSLTGKIRWCYAEPAALMRTYIYGAAMDGVHIFENVGRDLTSIHGNGISMYDQGAGDAGFTRYMVIENNYMDNVERGYTMALSGGSAGDVSIDRHNLITRNIFIGGANPGFIIALYSGEPGSTISENLIMGGRDWSYPQAVYLGRGNRVVLQNNVVAGIGYDTPNQALCSYTVQNNYMTVDYVPPNDGPTRIANDNTIMPGAPVEQWDGVITSEMAAELGPGPIGLFWNIAA